MASVNHRVRCRAHGLAAHRRRGTDMLATADRLFYGEGIRAVGVDRVVAEAQVTG